MKNLKIRKILFAVVCSLFISSNAYASESNFQLPFAPFSLGESFGCKSLIIPSAETLPSNPVIDEDLLPGWKSLKTRTEDDRTNETLTIKGSRIVYVKDKSGAKKGPFILIPAGGLVYDATIMNKHIPVGDKGILFGKTFVLKNKKVENETCRNFSILAGRSFEVGNSVITYLMPNKAHQPLVLWKTLDGVSIRPHPLDQYKVGHVPDSSTTRIFGVYTHSGQIADYAVFTAPKIQQETIKINGKDKTLLANSEWFKHFRIVPISCPLGHHIGLMVYNDMPILLDTKKELSLYEGYLKIKVKTIDSDGNVSFSLNGKTYQNKEGIDSLIGSGRSISGIENSIHIINNIMEKTNKT